MLRPLLVLALGIAPLMGELVATYSSAEEKTAVHHVPLPALAHEAGATPTPFLAPGPYTVVWRGELEVPKRLRLHFSFRGEGTASLKINNAVVLEESGTLGAAQSERTRLNPGRHPVEITYRPTENGKGSFRLFWEERSFAPEPIPAKAWKLAEGTTPPLAERGRAALAQQRCLHCHLPEQAFGDHAMPELSAPGPDLTGIGSRVTEEWLVRWIAQPDLLRPTTTMPAMVDHRTAEGAQQAADLAAYLATLTAADARPSGAPEDTLALEGGVHFHQLGCVACHTLPEIDIPDRKHERIPLNNLATKFQPGALTEFLKNPRAHHAWSKMPHFRFTDEEAAALAAFLRKESTGRHTPDPSEFPPGDPSSGKSLATSLNCAACHSGLPAPATNPAPPLGALRTLTDWTTKGCLAEDEQRGPAPRLVLAKEDRAALNAFALHHLDSLRRSSPAHYTLRQIEALNCRACHADHRTPALLSTLHPESGKLTAHLEGESERVDQSRPALTYMGEMLHTTSLESVLRGDPESRARPWLEMRMPGFPQHATTLAHGLGQLHGLPPSSPDLTPRNEEAAAIGKQLVGLEGLACITCHGIAEMKPVAAFEVMGINFAQSHERLQEDYFHRWLRNPHRIVPDSRMPRYTTEDGEGLRPDILDGDAQKQFDAIWEYLKAGPRMEQP